MPFKLDKQEKQFLLKLARQSILDYFRQKQAEPANFYSENLRTHSGAFVTLHKQGQLRGCIGYVKAFKPLQEAISDLAISAAFNDPRFPALDQDEYQQIDLEISVLTPLKKVDDISQIEIGRDGLLVKNGFYEGLLLPQVATDYGWDINTFLEQTCNKAGLPKDSWQDEQTEIFSFSAIIFDESQFPGTD